MLLHRRLLNNAVYINSIILVLEPAARKQIMRIAVERSPCYPQEPRRTHKSRLDASALALEGKPIKARSWSPLFRAFASWLPARTIGLIPFQGCLPGLEWSVTKSNMIVFLDVPFNDTLHATGASHRHVNIHSLEQKKEMGL